MITEKKKMIAGEAYFANDKTLSEDRLLAQTLCFRFNQLEPRQVKAKKQVIRDLFGKTEKMFYIEPPFRCDYGYNIEIGENFYANYNLTVLDCAPVRIGDNVMIAPNVSLFTAGHPIHHELRNTGLEYAIPITIGDNVWIGGNTVINPGVTIGENTVIGSGSVVTKDIPANVVAVGNPCRILRTITEEDKHYYYRELKIR
ncbi:sugar O-acetyltransferase [Sphingobacterium alkalisoli]|uniref:Acetyltransferase n=1 Tax=Sphingobacterium alkalisoli TaxID=1874115 RepID=A0A4U0GXI5_9SPHI|nr:sugar O-acetyltransferase [Sphingobacterium alkalisoli]TJY63857.1 sugar O-acetyltransferase [Sphingobacterium alkalisoli]GGH24418.1 maltose acetyltransferase [Sphingobacterium alkalisoli]